MIESKKTTEILFLDIETVPQWETYEEMPERFQKLWDTKAQNLSKDDKTSIELYRRAGIYAEFGKIVCICAGFIIFENGETKMRLKSISGNDETEILKEFSLLLNSVEKKGIKSLCAHNGKEFDFPYLCRRMLVNGLKIPGILNLMGKKPWETPHLDTMEMWKFGDFKNFTSLNLLAAIFDIPTPKDDIDGSMVQDVYWKEKNLNRIVTYCQKDVITLARLLLKFKVEGNLKDENVLLV